MNKDLIIESVNKLFLGVDDRDWELVSQVFGRKVFLDCTSISGEEPAELNSSDIIEGWKEYFPKFDYTYHQASNFVICEVGGTANMTCYVATTYYLKNDIGNNMYKVFGTYNMELKKDSFAWKITKMKFNLKFTEGNETLSDLIKTK